MKRLAQNPLAARLSQFVQSGRAAAGAAQAIASFSTLIDACGRPEWFSPLLAACRARSQRTDRSTESILSWTGSQIAAGDDPAQVLRALESQD